VLIAKFNNTNVSIYNIAVSFIGRGIVNDCSVTDQGRIQDFKLGGGALKKIAPSGGRRENFLGISCEKSPFYAPPPPPGSAPADIRFLKRRNTIISVRALFSVSCFKGDKGSSKFENNVYRVQGYAIFKTL
jgi:hypothetical protein